MSSSISAIRINTADPAALAAFWAQVVGRPVNPGATAHYAAIDATDPANGPKFTFHKVSELTAPENRVRLSLRTDQFEAESLRLVDLGAKRVGDFEKPGLRWTTFSDPDGHEFDLVTPQPAPAAE